MSIATKLARAASASNARAKISALNTAVYKHKAIRSLVTSVVNRLPAKHRKNAWVSFSEFDLRVSVTLRFDDLESLKDKTLTRALAPFTMLADADQWTASTADYPGDVPNRDYRFENSTPLYELCPELLSDNQNAKWLRKHADWLLPKHFNIVVFIYAYVKADSALCKSVVVEVKERVVTEEIKKIVCA